MKSDCLAKEEYINSQYLFQMYNIRDGVPGITGKCFTLLYIHGEPFIYLGRAGREGKDHTMGSLFNNPPVENAMSEQKEDLLIHQIYQISMGSIHYMRVVNTDALSHQNKSPYKCLLMVDKKKKRNYLEACLYQSRHF